MIGFRWLNPYGFAAAEVKQMAYSPAEFLEFFRDGMDYILEINKK